MRLARWLLGRVLHPADREPALCDLEEEYEARVVRDGSGAAARWYRAQVRRSLWPAIQRRFLRSVSRPSLLTELRWAWRGLRARRVAGVMHVTLVAFAAGASGIVFSAADAFAFRPAPYPNADRLVVFQRLSPVGLIDMLMEREHQAVSARSDLFTRLYVHTLGPSPLISIAGAVESVRTWDVEPGLFEALGVAPRWGRSFVPGDELPGREPIVILRADLARGVFGSPAAAIDRMIDTGTARLRVVGVMPADFRFPTSLDRIWRPLAPPRPGEGRSGQTLALLAEGVTVDAVSAMVEPLTAADGPLGAARAVLLRKAQKDPRAFTNSGAFTASDAPRLFSTLLGAMICLSAIIWLNIAGLALASALGRVRVRSLQTVLGATRATLVRTALLEAAIPTAAGAVVGLGLAVWGTSVLAGTLPPALDAILTNPIDLDRRAAAFMAAVAGTGAIVTALPEMWWASRRDPADRLRAGGSTVTMSRGHMATRYALMTGQLTLSVALLIVGALLMRSYAARLHEDRGFDSHALATIEVRQRPGSSRSAADLERGILARLQSSPFVLSASRTRRLPPGMRGGSISDLWIQGRPSPAGQVALANFQVSPEYFETMGIRLLAGRFPAAGATGEVVVDAPFAARFWPAGGVVGARFWTGRAASARTTVHEIVGVVSRVRLDTSEVPQGGALYVMHSAMPRDGAALMYVARLTAPERLGDLDALLRAAAAGDLIRTRLMAERYAEVYGDTRIAAALTGTFAVMALFVAIVGVYGVTSVLVAARTREIGIRIALGAGRDRIRRLVVMPTARLLAVGVAAGGGGAILATRWIDSQLFGVQPSDPATYVMVAAVVTSAALAATWRPSRRATRIDPVLTLRAE
jgi:predicted permease